MLPPAVVAILQWMDSTLATFKSLGGQSPLSCEGGWLDEGTSMLLCIKLCWQEFPPAAVPSLPLTVTVSSCSSGCSSLCEPSSASDAGTAGTISAKADLERREEQRTSGVGARMVQLIWLGAVLKATEGLRLLLTDFKPNRLSSMGFGMDCMRKPASPPLVLPTWSRGTMVMESQDWSRLLNTPGSDL